MFFLNYTTYLASFFQLYLQTHDFCAGIANMVESKHQGSSIYIHPLEQSHHSRILIKGIRSVDGGRWTIETNRLMVRYPIPQFVDIVQFLKYV